MGSQKQLQGRPNLSIGFCRIVRAGVVHIRQMTRAVAKWRGGAISSGTEADKDGGAFLGTWGSINNNRLPT